MPGYNELKKNLLETMDRLADSVHHETSRALLEIRVKLEQNVFNLVILGQFKRGKSTFINALLGETILPTAIIPLTSVVTILRYGKQLKIEVAFHNGQMEEVDLSRLPEYITERGNPENQKGVREVTIYYPSDYLQDGVRIIDTPGVGSVYRHNTDVAYSYLPFVDAGIFIVSADPPLSQSEHQFLKDIREYVDKLFFILNKIDQVSGEDIRESMAFTSHILEENLGTGRVKIFPLSARWALEGKQADDDLKLRKSLLPGFEQKLREFLLHEKGKVFLKSTINNLLKFISDETVSFQLEQEAVKLPLKELTAKIARFDEEIKTIEKDNEHNQYLLKGYLDKIRSELDEEIARFNKEKLPILHQALEAEYLKKGDQVRGHLRQELEQFVFEKIQETFQTWRRELTEKISTRLEGAHREFALKTNEVIERILGLTGSIFDLTLKPFTTVETLSKKSDFFFLLKDDPVGLELIQLAVTSALPRFLAKKIILKNMKTAVTDLLDRHCGRVRYDLIKRIEKTVKDFQEALTEKFDQTLDGIRAALQKALSIKQGSEGDVAKNLDDLSLRLSSISGIQEELSAHAQEVSHL